MRRLLPYPGSDDGSEIDMGLFDKKKKKYPRFPEGDYEPVLRCSICNGEQILCAREKSTGELHEVMLVRTPHELEEFCRENSLLPESIMKIY